MNAPYCCCCCCSCCGHFFSFLLFFFVHYVPMCNWFVWPAWQLGAAHGPFLGRQSPPAEETGTRARKTSRKKILSEKSLRKNEKVGNTQIGRVESESWKLKRKNVKSKIFFFCVFYIYRYMNIYIYAWYIYIYLYIKICAAPDACQTCAGRLSVAVAVDVAAGVAAGVDAA